MNAVAKIDAADPNEVIRVLQSSLYPGAKRESVELVMSYCRVNNLDPMLKPVHIVPTRAKTGQTDDKGKDIWETRDTLMPGIALYRILAARSGEYGGKSEPEYGPTRETRYDNVTVMHPEWCRVTVSRIVHGQARQFVAKELWLENVALTRTGQPTEMWQKRAFGQLAKCTEAQALRMAFPEYNGGAPTAEEMEGAAFDGPTLEHETPKPKPKPKSAREAINDEVKLSPSPSPDHGPSNLWAREKLLLVDQHRHLTDGWINAVAAACPDASSSADLEAFADEIRQRLGRSTTPEANTRIGAAIQAARKRLAAQPKPELRPEDKIPFPGDTIDADGVPVSEPVG